MKDSFPCLYSSEKNQAVTEVTFHSLKDLDPGDSLIEVFYSSLNYKDALGLLAKSPIYRKFPIIGGIDLSGTLLESSHPSLKKGQNVLITGCGLGESHTGGYSQVARVPHEWILPLPDGLGLKQSMQLGTAGFTASLAVFRLQQNGQTPEMGPILVTGASGGVGMISIQILSKLGYEVIALSAKEDKYEFLKGLGAKNTLHPNEIADPKGPLSSPQWSGCIDNVGGTVLEKILPQIDLWGNVCSIGVAAGAKFQATVMPHILRGVSLLGISSTNCPMPLRKTLWANLASAWKVDKLDQIANHEVTLDQLPHAAQELLDRKRSGRTIVNLKKVPNTYSSP